jgi:hypothetical protein
VTTALSLADPVAALITWLRAHATIVAQFGSADRVSGLNEAPYPRLMVAPSQGGSDRSLRWLIEPEVALATFGTLDGTPGQAELRRLHYVALAAAEELTRSTFGPSAAVVTAVRPSSAARYAPEPGTGQPVWRSTLLVSIHPPR